MNKSLTGKTIAILTETGFEESELMSPKKALEEAGATIKIVSPQPSIQSWNKDHFNLTLERDVDVADADEADFDGLLIPGGVINPDKMRVNEDCIKFAKSFLQTGKPVAAICHGPQLLIETGLLEGRTMTSFKSIKTDLENAGVTWEDSEVVTDNGLVTSRSPEDLKAFNKKIVEEFAEGVHEPA